MKTSEPKNLRSRLTSQIKRVATEVRSLPETLAETISLSAREISLNAVKDLPVSPAQILGFIQSADEETEDFSGLARKLERKISQIERDMRHSIEILESDVHKLVHKHRNTGMAEDIRGDINNLANLLEARVKSSIDNLLRLSQDKLDSEELKTIKKLSGHLMRILSFDFYRNVLGRLKQAQIEEEVDEFGMDPHLTQKIRPLFDFLYRKYWRVKTTGINNIPKDGRALIVANHSGALPYDGAMLKTAIMNEHPTRKDARFLVEDFVYHMPILGTFMYRIGGVRACPENAQRLLEQDHLVIVFPEGVKGIGKFYSQRYKLQRFGRGGFIKLCVNTRSPLVPVGIVGAEEIHPIVYKSNILAKMIGVPYLPITPTFPLMGLFGMIPFPTKWSIHFGEPILFDTMDKSVLDDELAIHKLSERVRSDIQNIIIHQLRQRRSVWLG